MDPDHGRNSPNLRKFAIMQIQRGRPGPSAASPIPLALAVSKCSALSSKDKLELLWEYASDPGSQASNLALQC
jgi:hypothetical protein